MNLPTFLGGVHPPEGKSLTEHKVIETLFPTEADEFIYPLSQHIGAPCSSLVKKGDRVLVGQKIADSESLYYPLDGPRASYGVEKLVDYLERP